MEGWRWMTKTEGRRSLSAFKNAGKRRKRSIKMPQEKLLWTTWILNTSLEKCKNMVAGRRQKSVTRRSRSAGTKKFKNWAAHLCWKTSSAVLKMPSFWKIDQTEKGWRSRPKIGQPKTRPEKKLEKEKDKNQTAVLVYSSAKKAEKLSCQKVADIKTQWKILKSTKNVPLTKRTEKEKEEKKDTKKRQKR